MGKRFFPASVAALFSLAMSGCGTVSNMRNEPNIEFQFLNKVPPKTIYGGARLDVSELRDGVLVVFTGFDPSDNGKLTTEERLSAPLVTIPFLIDLPLSLIGDTLTLPVTVFATFSQPANTPTPRDAGRMTGGDHVEKAEEGTSNDISRTRFPQ